MRVKIERFDMDLPNVEVREMEARGKRESLLESVEKYAIEKSMRLSELIDTSIIRTDNCVLVLTKKFAVRTTIV